MPLPSASFFRARYCNGLPSVRQSSFLKWNPVMNNCPAKEYKYYLFDADGTLFDTTAMIINCFRNTAKTYGLPIPDEKEIISNIGMTLRMQMEQYFGKLSDTRFADYRAAHMAHQHTIYRDYLRLCPGVKEALRYLSEKDKVCAVVTSRMPQTLTVYLKETGIYNYFSVLITPEDTDKHKPEPEPALEALRHLGAKPEQALFIGDSLFDIECGSRAGIDTAFVTWSHNNPDVFPVKPTWSIDDMRDCCNW